MQRKFMEYKDDDSRKQVSVLQGEEFSFGRILSRESSVVQSSRIYYRSAEGVPFKWEMQPGTPKHPPENEVIPPLNPPPAVQSMGLPRPYVDQPSKGSTRSRVVWFWKKFKKNQRVQNGSKESTNASNTSSERFERSEIGDYSDGEFIASFPNSSPWSSSFSSSSSSRGRPLQPSRSRRNLLEGLFGCSPWNVTAVLVCVAKRV